MDIREERQGGLLILQPAGRLDANTAPQLESRLGDGLDGVSELRLNLAELEYISSVGLRVVLSAQKQMGRQGGTMVLENLQDEVMDVFEMTRLTDLLDIRRTAEPEYFSVRPIQQWMFDTQLEHAKSTMLNLGGLFLLDGHLDMEKLAEAVGDMLSAHDVFGTRLVFHPRSRELCQIFVPQREEVAIEDITDADMAIKMKSLLQPYHLINQSLYRVRLFRTPTAQYLFIEFHHVLADGLALSYLASREIDRRYRGKMKKGHIDDGYREFLREEQQTPKELTAEGERYWQKVLSRFSPERHRLPVTEGGTTALGVWQGEVRLPGQKLLKELCLPEEPFFMAGMLLAMARLTGEQEAFLAWVHNGRDTVRKMRVMGLMLDELPLYWSFEEDCTVRELVEAVAVRQKEGLGYKNSLGDVYKRGLEDGLVCLLFQGEIDNNPEIAGVSLIPVPLPSERTASENVMDVKVRRRGDRYSLHVEYDTGMVAEETACSLMEDYLEILAAMTEEGATARAILEGGRKGRQE